MLRRVPLAFVCAGLCVCGLAGPCRGAVVPLRVTGSMSGAAEVTDHASGVSDTESFDAALRVSESEMTSTTTQRTRTASVGGQTAQSWSQCDAGTTEGGGLRAGVMSFASQGEGSLGTVGSQSCDRTARATTTQTTEFKVTGRAQAYRFRGTLTGVSDPAAADEAQQRLSRVRLVGEGGVVHEFDTAQAAAGSFDVSGTLEPGTYRVEVTTCARAASGRTRSADPMIASAQWSLEPTTGLAKAKAGTVVAKRP
ncbi:MAG TPA: hypothetical protein VHN77_15515 [Phycisphaerales bacterium]|nr:hypothetical protein [Phycisphaerales bacterium]